MLAFVYPLTIITDRYGGVYSGGQYTAWNRMPDDLPSEVTDNDCNCAEFWADPGTIVGCGDTPNAALEDLLCKLNDETFEVDIDGKHVVAYKHLQGGDLTPGDMYIAKRNTGWHMAKCGFVHHGPDGGWVDSDPFGAIYSYDFGECHKVKEIK